MKSHSKKLSDLALAAVLLAAGAAAAMAAQEASVVTVGDNAQGARNSTLWGLATRYMPPESQGKSSKELTAQEKNEIWKKLLAIQIYHNALAAEKNQGRPISDRNLIIKGEKLYLPPQQVIDDIVKLMPSNPSEPISAAKRDQLMRTVLKDVAENKDVIRRSKAGENLTTGVLATANAVDKTDDEADANLTGDAPSASRSLLEGAMPDQELEDESAPTDAVVLDTDGTPTAAPATDASTASQEGPIVDLTEKTASLESMLVTIELGANDAANPNRQKFKTLSAQIKAELARRKAEEEKQKEATASAAATAAASGPVSVATAPTAPTTAGQSQLADATDSADASDEPVEMENVPDWYLKALQEWNLQQYWQSKASTAKESHGRKKVLDPLTGKELEATSDDPFSEFSDELANYTRNQGQVEKRTGP